MLYFIHYADGQNIPAIIAYYEKVSNNCKRFYKNVVRNNVFLHLFGNNVLSSFAVIVFEDVQCKSTFRLKAKIPAR